MSSQQTRIRPADFLEDQLARVIRQWLFVIAASLLLVPSSVSQTWTLIWSDEFNGPGGSTPDPNNWKFETGNGVNGWGNAELEYYCPPGNNTPPCSASNPNIQLDGYGNLVIQAIKTSNPTWPWTSGRMKTQGLREFQYGRIEARMKLPVGAGLWPAFWMLGANIGTVGWPACGEQDIIEWVPQYTPTTTSSTIHGPGYSGGNGIGSRFTFPNGGRVDDAAFHTYGVIWSQDKMQFYRDDYTQPFFTVTPASIPAGKQWVYNHPFFILLNLAVGGNFPGPPNSTTPSPAVALVDYVRVYRQSPAVSVTSNANPQVFGQPVTFTATLIPTNATGTVQFQDGSINLGPAAVSGGTATFSTSSLSVGAHSITAIYNGDANFAGSTSPALTQSIIGAGATATNTTIDNIVISPNPTPGQKPGTVHLEQIITVAATVATAAMGTPTGSVALLDNGAPLGSGRPLQSGKVTIGPLKLSLGAHSVVATYFGDSTFQGSSSAAAFIDHKPKPR